MYIIYSLLKCFNLIALAISVEITLTNNINMLLFPERRFQKNNNKGSYMVGRACDDTINIIFVESTYRRSLCGVQFKLHCKCIVIFEWIIPNVFTTLQLIPTFTLMSCEFNSRLWTPLSVCLK